jgi:hypothetical protein
MDGGQASAGVCFTESLYIPPERYTVTNGASQQRLVGRASSYGQHDNNDSHKRVVWRTYRLNGRLARRQPFSLVQL